jgi:outer membrane biosynthesis protein TonB
MNPQPHPVVGQLGVLVFSLLVAYFCFTGNKKKSSVFSDSFAVGYIYDNIPYVEQFEEYKPKKTTVPVSNKPTKRNSVPARLITPTIKPKPKSVERTTPSIEKEKSVEPEIAINETLFNDCVLALVSLGTKKSQSKIIAKKVFDDHNPKTIEEFIKFVYLKS